MISHHPCLLRAVESGSVAGEGWLDLGKWLRRDIVGVRGEPAEARRGVGRPAFLCCPSSPVGAAWPGLEMGCHASAGSTKEARASPSRCCDGQ